MKNITTFGHYLKSTFLMINFKHVKCIIKNVIPMKSFKVNTSPMYFYTMP